VWSDTCYSNPEYDELFTEQQAAATVDEREQIVGVMQQILHDDRPEIVLWLENTLEAYRNDWSGFQEQLGPGQDSGELLFQYGKYSVLTVQPASVTSGTGGGDEGGIPAAVWVIGGIAVLVVAGVGIMASRRRRAEEDEV
jgi:peptide/nickel transport system substrate-binding protein